VSRLLCNSSYHHHSPSATASVAGLLFSVAATVPANADPSFITNLSATYVALAPVHAAADVRWRIAKVVGTN
jgi:hypothetical protein